MFQLLKFIFFNTGLPFGDVATDFSTRQTLKEDDQAFWAGLTLGWMFVPVIIRLATFLYQLPATISKLSDSDSECRVMCEVMCGVMLAFFRNVLLHLPFCLPLYNLYQSTLVQCLEC